MSDGSTPRPWAIHLSNRLIVPLADAGKPLAFGPDFEPGLDHANSIALLRDPDSDMSESEVYANAFRIVAAVNATSDLPIEALEADVVRKLVEAAEQVLHDWHSGTGFVAAVRAATGRPWPWPHGEESLANLRTTLALVKGEQQ